MMGGCGFDRLSAVDAGWKPALRLVARCQFPDFDRGDTAAARSETFV